MITVDDRLFQFDQLELGDLAGPDREARKLYSNIALVRVAAAAIHRSERALEYLTVAPVLVLGLSYGAKKITRAAEYGQIAGMFRNRVESGPKLRDVMRHYKIAPQLRRLSGKALSPGKAQIIGAISHEVGPSILAQSIPEKSFHQHLWLIAMDRWWSFSIRRRGFDPVPYPEWAASRLNRFTQREQLRVVSDLVDLAHGGRFDPRWTFDQAHQAMERWHVELGRMNASQRFKANHGIEYSETFKVAGLPVEWEFMGLRFVAVDSGEKLFDEGRAMHHCVSTYVGACIGGNYAVFSIRGTGDKRLATFGLRRENGWWLSDQVKGSCNRPVATAVHAAVQEFMKDYRKSRGAK